ncbi:hypothetical protein PZE06_23770 [Robertmurraya sp. DFI.2.37]|uniref:hypothetical protein n=1 Tax=Robertmurraya sp. DFI.2.37 TaxID=3031819 RepID=UPI001246C1A0|nr:hypothetical protein [Robertmurraya sp. DFI.2.37]MDF1511153.1 hypothetical protein [Robertmurraya sp. DFI.2.37]
MKNIKTTKQIVGKKVFSNFEKMVTREHFTKGLHLTRIEAAAEIVEEMPFVTLPLRDKGIIRKGEGNAHLLHTFRPNLWAQDYAHEIGELGKMTVTTAIERANASVEYVLETSASISRTLKKTGTSDYDFFLAMREAAMIESAYYTRLGGGEMPEQARKKIDVALMRRALRNESMFKTILRHAGVSEIDGLALLQFADEIDLTEILQEILRLDPYFNRRIGQVELFNEINSEESIKLNHTKTDRFAEELLSRMAKKHPALFRKIAKMTGFGNIA